MSFLDLCRSSWLRGAVVAALAASVCGCGGDDDGGGTPAPVAVLSAFPGETAPVVEQATIESTVMVNGKAFRVGTLGGVRVVIGLTGIGLLNAAMTTRAVLDQFNVAGVVVSAVAGSPLRIGDVIVPHTWALPDGTTYPADRRWLSLAGDIAAAGIPLDRCTEVPMAAENPVCLPNQPAVFVGGVGQSSDPFGDTPVACRPGGGDVFGCDIPAATSASSVASARPATTAAAADAEAPIAEDMETAAIAREAAARGVPFIAFRAVSDGAGDPLDLGGFPAQFFAYYPLAARNAAAATVAFLERLAGHSP